MFLWGANLNNLRRSSSDNEKFCEYWLSTSYSIECFPAFYTFDCGTLAEAATVSLTVASNNVCGYSHFHRNMESTAELGSRRRKSFPPLVLEDHCEVKVLFNRFLANLAWTSNRVPFSHTWAKYCVRSAKARFCLQDSTRTWRTDYRSAAKTCAV